jgi:hypothetical protein
MNGRRIRRSRTEPNDRMTINELETIWKNCVRICMEEQEEPLIAYKNNRHCDQDSNWRSPACEVGMLTITLRRLIRGSTCVLLKADYLLTYLLTELSPS